MGVTEIVKGLLIKSLMSMSQNVATGFIKFQINLSNSQKQNFIT